MCKSCEEAKRVRIEEIVNAFRVHMEAGKSAQCKYGNAIRNCEDKKKERD